MAVQRDQVSYADLSVQQRRCLGSPIFQLTLPAGTHLYKFTEYNILVGADPVTGRPGRVTEWWAFRDPRTHCVLSDPGLDYHIDAAARAQLPMATYARLKFAVMFQWNGLTNRSTGLARVQHIMLTRQKTAFVGPGAPMPAYELDASTASRPGPDYFKVLTPAQQRATERMWAEKARHDVGTDRLPGGAVQVLLKCHKDEDLADYIRVGAIQLLA